MRTSMLCSEGDIALLPSDPQNPRNVSFQAEMAAALAERFVAECDTGDAPPACPIERPRAHMGYCAAATAEPLRARSGARPLDEGRATMLAGDGERQAGAADAPRTLVHGPIHHPYLYGWAPVHTV